MHHQRCAALMMNAWQVRIVRCFSLSFLCVGTCITRQPIPTTGITTWSVRIITPSSSWVCFGVVEPRHVTGNSDWSQSYSFCTCCDGYPKGTPRWSGSARGTTVSGDVFRVTVDRNENTIAIVGPRGVNMQRKLPPVQYVMYFNNAAASKLVVEWEF